MMREFRIREDGFKEVRARILKRGIPITLIIGTGVVVIIDFMTTDTSVDGNVLLFQILIVFGALVLGIVGTLKRLKKTYDTYVLMIDDVYIIRKQHNTPSIEIPFSEIKKISKNKRGDYIVVGKSKMNAIFIPSQVENLEVLERRLGEICKVSVQSSKSIARWLVFPLAIVFLGLMGIIYYSYNTILVGISGTLLTGLIVWSFVIIQRNKNFDRRTKRSSYLMIIFLLSVIGTTIYKFMVIY